MHSNQHGTYKTLSISTHLFQQLLYSYCAFGSVVTNKQPAFFL